MPATKRILGFALAGALAISLASPALAHKERFKTRVTIEEVKPNQRYEGDVKSRSRACERRRELQFWYDDPVGDDVVLGKPFRADRNGHWEFEVLAGSNYYVTVKRIVKTPGDHKHVCKGDRSPTV